MKMAEYLLLHCKAEDAGIGELLDAVSSAADERIALALAASVGDAVMEATEVEATQGRYYSKGQVSLAQSMLVIDNVRALLCVEQKRLRQIAQCFLISEATEMAAALERVCEEEVDEEFMEDGANGWNDWREVQYHG